MKAIPLRVVVAALVIAAACAWAWPRSLAAPPAPQQPAQKKPISKEGMIRALKINGLSLQEFVHEVETRGVDFEVTPEVVHELREAGAAPRLIAAARANYRPPAGAATPAGTPAPTAPRRGLQVAAETETPATATPAVAGRFHALVIGNNAYEFMPRLKTAEADARAVEAVLRGGYGFETKLLLNATRQQIISQINAYRRSLDPEANLLIYYAGHGYNDEDADKGYWLPVDARLDDNANWISADDINTNIKVVPARHVLVVSDSCYSGTIYRAAEPSIAAPAARGRYLDKMLRGKSRTLMASGGKEPVTDGGGGRHSIFAAALLRGLRETEADAFTGMELFRDYVQEAVAGRSAQTPEYSPLRNSGHEGGDFVFIRRK